MTPAASESMTPRPHAVSRTARAGAREAFVLLGAVVLGGLVLELAARALVPAPLAWNWPQARYEPNAALGFRLRPRQHSYTADKPFRTNAMGLRGPERSREKPAGSRRVLLLGDSIAFGYGVAEQDSFAQQLEALLNRADPGRSYEVINSGVPSFNTRQEVAFFREEGVGLDPDVVILAICWNDISDKSQVMVNGDGQLFDASARPAPPVSSRWAETEGGYRVRNLLKRSSLLYFVVDRVRTLRGRDGAGSQEAAIQRAVLGGQDHPAVTAGWAAMDEQLAALAELCASRGIRLLVALMPMPPLVEGPYPKAQYPGRVLRTCEKLGLSCVDLHPAFQRQFAGHASLFIPYDGDHPNEQGHLLIAERLHAALRESGAP